GSRVRDPPGSSRAQYGPLESDVRVRTVRLIFSALRASLLCGGLSVHGLTYPFSRGVRSAPHRKPKIQRGKTEKNAAAEKPTGSCAGNTDVIADAAKRIQRAGESPFAFSLRTL